MDITIFMFFTALALVLSIVAYFLRGNLGLGLAFLAAGLFFIIGALFGNGETITNTIYFNSTEYAKYALDLGISTSNIMILFALAGILNITTAVADWIGF